MLFFFASTRSHFAPRLTSLRSGRRHACQVGRGARRTRTRDRRQIRRGRCRCASGDGLRVGGVVDEGGGLGLGTGAGVWVGFCAPHGRGYKSKIDSAKVAAGIFPKQHAFSAHTYPHISGVEYRDIFPPCLQRKKADSHHSFFHPII